MDLEIQQLDFVTAYLNSDLDEYILAEQIKGFKQGPLDANSKPKKVYQLKKGLYGLKQSARQWYKKCATKLKKLGFRPLPSDDAVFIRGKSLTDSIVITLYVDDLTIFGKDINKINQLKQDLRIEFELNDLGDIAYYLGLKVRRNRAARTITLS